MSNLAFLNKFQQKISTVTAQGNFQQPNGEQVVRQGTRSVRKPSKSVVKVKSNNELEPKTLPKDTSLWHRNDPTVNGKVKGPAEKATFREMSYQQTGMDAATTPEVVCHVSKSRGSSKAKNESLAKGSRADQLAYSKKARSVQYEPCTLNEYKRTSNDKYYELGKLQPNLNDTELLAKRANQERIKAFSKSLRTINQQSSTNSRAVKVEPSKVPSARAKALAFAKAIPKPAVRDSERPEPTTITKIPEPCSESNGDALAALQSKHNTIQSQIDAIRKDVAM